MADASTETPPDVNRGGEILAITGTMVGLALAFVALRIVVRLKVVKHLGGDDWVMIAAMVVMFVEMMVIIPQVKLGAGRHWQYIDPPENITKGLHLNFITQPLCLIGLCLTKISVGLFLLRITPSKGFKWFIKGCIVFTVLSSTGNLLTVFFQCRPLALTWDASVPGQCIPPAHLKFAAFFNSSVSVLTDLVFALLPIPMLWNVQLNWKVKSAIAGVLSLGVFASAAAIIKITFLSNYGKHGDFLFDSSDLTIWTTIEICTAIIAASIPSLKPLFRAVLAGSSARYASSRFNNSGYVRNKDSQPKSSSNRTRSAEADDFEMSTQARPAHHPGIASGYDSDGSSKERIVPRESECSNHHMTKGGDFTILVDDVNEEKAKEMV